MPYEEETNWDEVSQTSHMPWQTVTPSSSQNWEAQPSQEPSEGYNPFTNNQWWSGNMFPDWGQDDEEDELSGLLKKFGMAKSYGRNKTNRGPKNKFFDFLKDYQNTNDFSSWRKPESNFPKIYGAVSRDKSMKEKEPWYKNNVGSIGSSKY